MSLLVTGDTISIQNASNVTKFTSKDKLVYLKAANTGTFNINPSQPTAIMPFGASITSEKDFFMMYLKFNSSTGNAIVSSNSNILGRYIPANGSIFVHFTGYKSGYSIYAESEIITSGLVGSNIYFRSLWVDYIQQSRENIKQSSNITYKAYLYSYL